MKSAIGFLGRLALSLVFIFACASKILNWQSSLQTFDAAIVDWQTMFVDAEKLYALFGFLIPLTPFLLLGATILEGLGSLMLILGMQSRLAAAMLILVLVPATLLFHGFWAAKGADRELQSIMFFKNVSILGGLLIVLAQGTAKSSSSPKR